MHLLALVLALAQASTPTAPEAPAAPPGSPVVVLEVRQGMDNLGAIKMVLRPDKAPISVANFLEYLRAGHYEGTIFHRVMPGFMIQGGGFTPEMVEKPERPPIRNEARNRLRNSRGAVAMARTDDPNSATSQFFINARNNHNLDFGIAGMGYAVFGHVIEGMEVVDLISTTPTTRRGEHENTPVMPVVIERAYEVEPTTADAAGP